jgi:hypothetical protein
MPSVEGHYDTSLGLSQRWKMDLLTILCKYNYCEAIFQRHYKGTKYNKYGSYAVYENERTVTLIGRPENIDVVKYLFGLLVEHFERLSAKEWKGYISEIRQAMLAAGIAKTHPLYKNPTTHKNVTAGYKFKNSFYAGAVYGVKRRLQEQLEKAEIEHEGQMNALIRVNDADIQAYIKANMGKIGKMRNGGSDYDSTAFSKGVKAGQNASMARGVSTGDTIATRLLA